MTAVQPGARVGLVVNPAAGGHGPGASTSDLTRLLGAAGHPVVTISGRSAGEVLLEVRRAIRAGAVDVLLVAGGDGTTHLGVNACAGTDVPLLALGQGTGNDLAHDWGLPLGDPVAVVDLLEHGVVRQVDAVRVDEHDLRPWFGGVLYGGFDSVVNARANSWTWPRGGAKYTLAVMRELPMFRPIPYSIEVDGHRLDTEAMLVTVANTCSYGGGMRVCPQADCTDGLLDVLVLHEVNRVEFLRVFPKVYSGEHLSHPAVELLRGRRVRLVADDVEVYADGEPFGRTPITCEVVPGALRVITPPADG